jgi:hypothetical protein
VSADGELGPKFSAVLTLRRFGVADRAGQRPAPSDSPPSVRTGETGLASSNKPSKRLRIDLPSSGETETRVVRWRPTPLIEEPI